MLTPATLPLIQDAIGAAGVEGWLLFDFRGLNPVAGGMLHLEGLLTRRIFVYVPKGGAPTAVTHAIEQGPWSNWPAAWPRVVYSGWRELEAAVASLVGGRRVAMEYSPGDAVPYLDLVPAGVLEMIRQAGATVVSSGELVSRFYAAWDAPQLAAHRRAARALAEIGRDAIRVAGERAAARSPLTEYAIQGWILDRMGRAGLKTVHRPIVATGPHAADPHYEPSEANPTTVGRGDVLLIDLWASEPGHPSADQTWMGVLGNPDARTVSAWEAVRDARDAAIALLRERSAAGRPVRGAEVDDAARAVIESRGYGRFFTHRTGHSIDPRDLHGSGPHLDNLESRDDRVLIPGVAFSIEPGIYQPNVLGVRTEVNAIMEPHGVLVTPEDYQRELLIV